ncbi:hypothetical protein TNCV_1569291 [Trichonephila clavipes]|uniref:Uncharacterized protein n=1 Tax=Trichonephila clavipes TaxID=2585209 RepID=A0A8X6VP22_TRICX|nr:hypothetical protein TNCV_1569291 [Trichonephila clavipes]
MDKCVQMLDKNPGPLDTRRPRSVFVFRTNRTREAKGRLMGPANEKGCGVDPPWGLKGFFRRQEESPEKKRLGRWRIKIGAEREERPCAFRTRHYPP